MRCPNCNTEVDEKELRCPHCGAELHQFDDDEPTIGRGMVIFIIIGTIFLVTFGALYYQNHKNDPEYTQTAIEPDPNLAEKNVVKFDTAFRNPIKKDSMAEEEAKEAEKVLNSIRGKAGKRKRETPETGVSSSEAEPLIVPSHPNAGSNGGKPEVTPGSTTPTVPKPHIENIETE